jgi:hypothetical protein
MNAAISQDTALSKRISGMRIFSLASLAYFVCMILFFYPYLREFTTNLIGPPEDNMQDFWNTWYSQVTLDANPRSFFYTQLIKFPEGTSLHYQSFSYSNLFIILIVRKLVSLPINRPVLIGMNNGVLLLSFYLAAIGAFYLTRRFTTKTLSALFGGFIFGFSPFHVAHLLHHMHVATIQYIPFFVNFFLSAVDTKKPRYLVGSILFYFLSAISCWYYLFYIGYFILFYYVYHAVAQRTLIIRRLLWPISANILGVMVLLLPLVVPMFLEGLTNENVYAPGHDLHVADVVGYFVFQPGHLFSGDLSQIYSHFTGNLWEVTVYLGIVNIALFIWAFLNRDRLHLKEINFLLCGIMVFMMFASGTRLHIYGIRTLPVPTGIAAYIPFLKNVRTPSRAIVFVYLFLGIGVSLAINAILENYASRKHIRIGLVAVLGSLVFADFYPTRLESTRLECLPAHDVITQDKDPNFGLLDLPRGYVPGDAYMMYQSCHGKPIVVATVTRNVTLSLSDMLETVDLDAQKKQLEKNRVKYIVVHENLNSTKSVRKENVIRIEDYQQTYPVVYSDKETVVFRVY